jgi:hypothetical protein
MIATTERSDSLRERSQEVQASEQRGIERLALRIPCRVQNCPEAPRMPDEAKVVPSGVGLTEAVGKWVAVIGSVVAVGQAAANWVSGYWQAEAQKEKSAQELRLAELKDRSGLATDYLKLILSKDTAEPDRVSFLDALSKIEGHPLQAWASARTKAYQNQITRLFETFKAQNDAVQKRAGIDRDVAVLTADIERLNEEILIHKDDEAKRNQLQAELVSKSADLGRLKGTQTLAVVKVEETATLIAVAVFKLLKDLAHEIRHDRHWRLLE